MQMDGHGRGQIPSADGGTTHSGFACGMAVHPFGVPSPGKHGVPTDQVTHIKPGRTPRQSHILLVSKLSLDARHHLCLVKGLCYHDEVYC